MPNNRSRVEARLERMLATTPPTAARTTSTSARVDLVFLADDHQSWLDQSIREP